MWIIFSFIAAFLTTFSFFPQSIKVVVTKNTKGISLFMYILFTAGVILWVIYGLGSGEYAVGISNLIILVFAIIILLFKIINVKKGVDKNGHH